jgi:hypothetical protein
MSVGRFSDAEQLFRRSVNLVPKASAAFNLAVALRGMGRPKEAHDTLTDLLSGKYGELPGDMRHAVEDLAREAARDVASLSVTLRGAPNAELRVDGVKVGTLDEAKPLSVPVNPGERVVTLSARLRETVERRVVLAAGKSAKVEATLTLSRAARMATLILTADTPDRALEIVGVARGRGRLERKLPPGKYTVRVTGRGSTYESTVLLEPATERRVVLDAPPGLLLKSPWFWTAAVAIAAGATLGGYFLLRDREQAPVRDPEFSVTQTLSRQP